MKLSRLFVIAMLVGTVGVFGCSDDEGTGGTGGTGGAGGTGGTGGNGTGGTGGTDDPCTGNLCDAPEPKAACEAVIVFCNSDQCCGTGGVGGDGGGIDPTPAQCDAAGQVFCEVDFDGTGGNGGDGGDGGAGGTGAADVCLYCDSDEEARILECEETYDQCIAADLGGNVEEKCAIIALSRCGP